MDLQVRVGGGRIGLAGARPEMEQHVQVVPQGAQGEEGCRCGPSPHPCQGWGLGVPQTLKPSRGHAAWQLVCAWPVLIPPHHPTAAPQTDALIQRTIRRAFAERTTLTIAHRLDTVMGCDAVLVFGSGKLLESGNPAELARKADPPGPFARLVAAAERARSGKR